MFGTCPGWSTLVKQQLELIEKKQRLLDVLLAADGPIIFFPSDARQKLWC